MGQFNVFRGRVLSALVAAGVAQACGGTTDGGPSEESEGNPRVNNAPGCQPVLDLSKRIDAARGICGPGAVSYCTETTSTECLDAVRLTASLRDCATPVRQGTCPAPTDLVFPFSCTVLSGDAQRVGTQCCYPVTQLSCPVPGRPLRVGGEVLLPEVVAGAPLPSEAGSGVDPATSRALAELWCEAARYEHASVASFARSTLQLMAFGAPMELVAASQAAALDEIEHARLCFSLASRFGGRELRAGRLATPTESMLADVDLAEFAVENVVGGCVGETVAALTAALQVDLATDPEVRAVLERIAEDEARHAELAWRIAAWASRVGGPTVRGRMASAFETALEVRAAGWMVDPPNAAIREGLGQLGPAREHAIRGQILAEVVNPCARALLGNAASAA